MTPPDNPVDAHLARFSGPQRKALEATRRIIATALPGAQQVISYGVPSFKVGGTTVVGFDGFVDHNSLFPFSGSVIESLAGQLSQYSVSKGTVQFPLDRAFPAPLVKRIVHARIAEINASYPKKGGEVKEFHANGHLARSGRMRDARLHGLWKWYRRDGSLMRTGSFHLGARTGTWTTYDRSGDVVRTASHTASGR